RKANRQWLEPIKNTSYDPGSRAERPIARPPGMRSLEAVAGRAWSFVQSENRSGAGVMAANTLIRCAGLAGLASGLLISLAFVIHPKANAQGMQSGIYVPLHVVILLRVVPALLCL